MKKRIVLVAALVACGGSQEPAPEIANQPTEQSVAAPSQKTMSEIIYPETRREDVVDNYHGTEVADPYRWLEDDNAPEVEAWVAKQNEVTFAYLDSIAERKEIEDRLTTLWNYEKFGIPRKIGDRYFFSKNDGLQNQSVLYWTTNLESEPKVLLDPNALSKDGTVALAGYAISDDGKLMAYGLATAGSDWNKWKVRSVDTGKDFEETLEWVKFSTASWDNASKGFYYSRYPEPKEGDELKGANFNHTVYYHRVGTPQTQDRLVYRRPDQPKWGFGAHVSEDGRYLVCSVSKGTGEQNLFFYRDLKKKSKTGDNGESLNELISEWKFKYEFIDNNGPVFWFHTDDGAPRGRVIAIDIRRPQRNNWKELIPESRDTLVGVTTVGGLLFADYLADASTRIRIYDERGRSKGEVSLPGIGSAGGFGGRRKHKETFYSFTSFNTPGTIYRYDLETGESTLFRRPTVDFNPDDYVTQQVFYESKDGTRVPMFLSHRKDLEKSEKTPVLLYGYGGFNIPLTPSYSTKNLVWMERGGILAIPNLRGGGEYGREWHEAGTKERKQNVFDDFIAAAEWLIEGGHTSKEKLAIHGGSNGGLLVGAVMTQRPDLFGAALPAVGVLDMLRFHKFTIGWAWIDDYGSADDPEGFEYLYRYSPYHKLEEGVEYPATMVTTGDHDDRVVPAHSFKFAAALQHAHRGKNPVLIRIQTKAGHGAGKPTKMLIRESADVLAFLHHVLHLGSGKPDEK